jgi:hypothetical protein
MSPFQFMNAHESSHRIITILGLCGSVTSGCGADVVAAGPADTSNAAPKCAATPTQLVDFDALAKKVGGIALSPVPLAVDATNVYFVFANALMRVPIRGGEAVTMFAVPVAPDLALTFDLIEMSTGIILHYPQPQDQGTGEQLISVPLQGGTPMTLASSSGPIFGFGVDERNVYFVDQTGMKSVPAIGGRVQLLSDQVTSLTAFGDRLAVVGSNVIAATMENGGSIVAVPLLGGPPTALATQQPNVSFPMSCGTDTCWWTAPTPAGVAGTQGPGAIDRLGSGGMPTVVAQAPYFPGSLAFDGTYFFESVGCECASGPLLRIPADGGPSVSMGSGGYLAVGDSCVYWSTGGGISSLSKLYAASAGQ